MTFLYSFSVFFQPGIFWPALEPYKPVLVISIIGALAGFLRKAEYSRGTAYTHPAFVYLSLFVVVQVISVYYSGFSAMLDTFLRWYQYIAYMLVAVLLVYSIDNLFRYIWGMILGGMFIVCYGIYVALEEIGTTVGGHAAGAYGMYENHNDYTYVIILILPFIYLFWKETKGLRSFLLLVFMGLCVAGIFLSLSRGGVLALVFEVCLLLLLTEKGKKRYVLLLLTAVLSISAIGYLWAKRDQYSSAQYTAADAKYSREELWKAGWQMFVKHPVLGVGSDRFEEYAKEYYDLSHDQKDKNAHNTYVQIIATTGILGMIAFLGYISNMIKSLLHKVANSFNQRLEMIRIATLVSFLSLLFRALTNAKLHEWGFYMLCVIAVTCTTLKMVENKSGADLTDYNR